jgi:hypothetical protein
MHKQEMNFTNNFNPNSIIYSRFAVFGVFFVFHGLISTINIPLVDVLPLIGMIFTINKINGSILHSEIKTARYILAFLAITELSQAFMYIINFPLIDSLLVPINSALWSILYIIIGCIFFKNTYLFPNEKKRLVTAILNFSTGIFHGLISLTEFSAFLGIIRPIVTLSNIPSIFGIGAGISILSSFLPKLSIIIAKNKQKRFTTNE